MKEKSYFIKRGVFDSLPRKLIINPCFIKYEDKNLLSDLSTLFFKEEIASYRFGIKPIKGVFFTYGREYLIYIQNKAGKIIKIRFKSFLTIEKKKCKNLHEKIVNLLWEYYFDEISHEYIRKFNNEEEFQISNVLFTKVGLAFKIIGEELKVISWDKVGTRDFQTYFEIFATNDQMLNRKYNYFNDWNTGLLYSIVRLILYRKSHNK